MADRRDLRILLTLITFMIGCRASHEEQDKYIQGRFSEIQIDLPAGVSPHSKYGRTLAYWNKAAGEMRVCADEQDLMAHKVSFQRAGNEVIALLRALPTEGVDEEAVNGVMAAVNTMVEDNASTLSAAGEAAGSAAESKSNGVGEAITGSIKAISKGNEIRARGASQVGKSLTLLKARYGGGFKDIIVGCLSGFE